MGTAGASIHPRPRPDADRAPSRRSDSADPPLAITISSTTVTSRVPASATPRISTVIPNYNYGRYVGRAVDSILGQLMAPEELEVVVVDDASTDESWQVLQRYRDHPRVTLIRHETNAGIGASWNDGIAASRGRYILNLDSDDLALDPNALALEAELLDAHPRAGLVLVDHVIVDENDAPIGRKKARVPPYLRSPDAFRRLLVRNFITHSGVLLRRACIEDVGGYDPAFVFNQDLELWLRIASRWDLVHLPRPLFAYRFHERSMFFRTVDVDLAIRALRQVHERAATYSPLPDTQAVLRESLAYGHLMRASMLFARGRRRAGLADLYRAARIRPASLLSVEAARAVARLVLRLVLAGRAPRVTAALRRRIYRGRPT
jgi:glycosyltransferase involved in cell wall biosynthesis